MKRGKYAASSHMETVSFRHEARTMIGRILALRGELPLTVGWGVSVPDGLKGHINWQSQGNRLRECFIANPLCSLRVGDVAPCTQHPLSRSII
jgi:hypothetical protein